MIISIDFKTYLDTEKNSEIIGRMSVAYYSKINETLYPMLAKDVVWIDQNTKLMYKMQLFLSTTSCIYKKIFRLFQDPRSKPHSN
ncbi:MAG TPA: hypothetical protein DCO75_08155 [Fibrobacteres bacterium]|jgi:hypothetical protein|nr:hypothetical protein [Fibrobacterota bacterium]